MFITVPKPIIPKTIDGEEFTLQVTKDGVQKSVKMGEISLHRYLMLYIINEPVKDDHGIVKLDKNNQPEMALGQGNIGGIRGAKLDRLFSDAKPGDIVEIDQELYDIVKRIIKFKSWGAISLAMQWVTIEEAWNSAMSAKPETLKAVGIPTAPEAPRAEA